LKEESRSNLLSEAAPFAGTETLEPDIEAVQETNTRGNITPQNTQTQPNTQSPQTQSIWQQSR
jgi:hypothetical protein